MAEAIGLGASIITFITVLKAVSPIYSPMKDAPDDITHLRRRLQDLAFILEKIDHTTSLYPQYAEDSATESYWNQNSTRLRSDFNEFETFAKELNTSGKVRWILTNHDRVKKLLDHLSEDIAMLNSLHQLIMDS